MTFRGIDENEAQEAVDRLLADLMDDVLVEPEKPSVRSISVVSNGRQHKVKVQGNLLWFPNVRRKAK